MQIDKYKVLVTGGASGMGKQFTLSLARDGASVALCDVNADAIAAVEAEAAGLPGKVKGFVANVAKEDDVVALVKNAAAALGGLNGLINNAGILRDGMLVKLDKEGKVQKMSLAHWQAVIDVNLTGVFLCTREFAAHCIETQTRPATVVSISSISRHGNMGQTNYSAAKAGIVADTKLWAGELARYGIRTGAIAPGFTRTPILEAMRPEVLEAALKPVPLRRLGEPEEMYLAAKFIFENDYFTGRVVEVDGGLSL
ncbi:MAG: SDR family oxidoreductase [Deltaproteobacteria bacterium]|nr:SDR family oxidoreductase [Deltaproteobacteria bacterium]